MNYEKETLILIK